MAGVVLAAGAGRRFGMPKALIEHRGELLVERAARILAEGGCEPVLVVLGAAVSEVRERADLSRARTLTNPDWPSGMGTSLRTALDALQDTPIGTVIVLPVDMPGVSATAVRRVREHAAPTALAAASHAGRRGHPVLLGRTHWPGCRAAAIGDTGARDYLRQHNVTLVNCDDVSSGADVDRPEDLDPG